MRSPSWRTLNAYVDGALDASEAGAVATAAGNDPEIAEQIAALYRLKGVTRDAFAAAPADLAPISLPRGRRWPGLARAAAAAVVLVAVLAAALTMSGPGTKPVQATLPADLMATARNLHSDWLMADAAGVAEDSTATLIGALAHFRQLPTVPDLESAHLTITRVKFADRDPRPVLQVGYRGVHGCHLSLFVFAEADLPDAMAGLDIGNERAYGWQVNELGYLLFAVGMDRNMLDLIAQTVEQQTRTHAPFDGDTREALAEQKRHSSSCVT